MPLAKQSVRLGQDPASPGRAVQAGATWGRSGRWRLGRAALTRVAAITPCRGEPEAEGATLNTCGSSPGTGVASGWEAASSVAGSRHSPGALAPVQSSLPMFLPLQAVEQPTAAVQEGGNQSARLQTHFRETEGP